MPRGGLEPPTNGFSGDTEDPIEAFLNDLRGKEFWLLVRNGIRRPDRLRKTRGKCEAIDALPAVSQRI